MDIKIEKNNILLFIISVLIILLVIFSRFFYTNLRKCRECKNEEACQWLHSWSSNNDYSYNNKNNEIDSLLKSEYPKEFKLSGISYPDTESTQTPNGLANIKLFRTNNGDASKYMIHYYDLKRSENMITVETIDSNDNRGKGEYELKGLHSGTEYSVIMYAINEYGISVPSNLISLKT